MKVRLDMDEKWPVFTLVTPEEHQNKYCITRINTDEFVEIPDELAQRFLKIQVEYLDMQKQLEEIYDRAQNEDGPEAAENSLRDYLLEDPKRVHGIP